MLKRVSWKKGMKLTEDVLRASDDCATQLSFQALALAGAGRFGLLPSVKPFGVSLNVSDRMVDVLALSCRAITKDGQLIDTDYDTRYSNAFDTRVRMPDVDGCNELILTIGIDPKKEWRNSGDIYEEPEYIFALLPADTPIRNEAVPIARIVNDRGWREDDVDFVPPCLFVASHHKYQDLLLRFAELLRQIDAKVLVQLGKGSHPVLVVFWPIIRQLMIAVNKEQQLLTPEALMGKVQQCVSAFVCAYDLCKLLNIENLEAYRSYIAEPFSYKNAYRRIEEGLRLCFTISESIEKLEVVAAPAESRKAEPLPMVAAPMLEERDIYVCSSPKKSINLLNWDRRTTVFFTTNGTEPTKRSHRAEGGRIEFDSGFRQENGREADKQMKIRLIAYQDDMESDIASYLITLRKDLNFREAKRI